MAKGQLAADTRILEGIDISKNRHEMLIAVTDKMRRRHMKLLNTADDFQRVMALLRGFEMPVTIGFEATGDNLGALMHTPGAACFDLKLVSPVALTRTWEALHNSRDKNDLKDGQVIMHMLEIGAVQISEDPLVVGIGDIQKLSKT